MTPLETVCKHTKLVLLRGVHVVQPTIRRIASGATITRVKKQSAGFTRRKLSTVIRKAITSYYTEHEQVEVARAAERQNVSLSSFVASAALKEARRLNRK